MAELKRKQELIEEEIEEKEATLEDQAEQIRNESKAEFIPVITSPIKQRKSLFKNWLGEPISFHEWKDFKKQKARNKKRLKITKKKIEASNKRVSILG